MDTNTIQFTEISFSQPAPSYPRIPIKRRRDRPRSQITHTFKSIPLSHPSKGISYQNPRRPCNAKTSYPVTLAKQPETNPTPIADDTRAERKFPQCSQNTQPPFN